MLAKRSKYFVMHTGSVSPASDRGGWLRLYELALGIRYRGSGLGLGLVLVGEEVEIEENCGSEENGRIRLTKLRMESGGQGLARVARRLGRTARR